MDNRDNQLTGEESFSIIQQMIETAKREQNDDGLGWISWGWMLFVASALTVINLHTNWVNEFFFWNAFGLATIVFMVISSIRSNMTRRKARVKTYTKEIYNKLNIGFAITLMLIVVGMNVGVGPKLGFCMLMAIYGFWVLIYGALFNFKPSQIGSYFIWACALAGMFMKTWEWVMILHGAAVFAGYIIPGHMAYYEFKKAEGRQKIKRNVGV